MRCMHVLLAVLFVGLLCKGSWAFPRCCWRRTCNCPHFRRLFGPRNHGHGILTVGKRQRGEGEYKPLPRGEHDPSHGGLPTTLVDIHQPARVDLDRLEGLPELTLDHEYSDRKNHLEHSKVWDLLHHLRRLLNLTAEADARSRRRVTDLQPYEATPRHWQISMRR
ncbi:uncharacterized protein [Branchiostoma lanceolatum]|uniref:uncharacterized protein n=1 Tax=Branchiostoma lanceolatum TaxID=7740 RepID=UPI0034538475